MQGLLFCLLVVVGCSVCSTLARRRPLKHRQHKARHAEWDGSLSNDTYDPSQGLRNLYFAYGAYCDSTELENWSCKWCDYIPDFQVSKVYDLDKLQVFMGYDVDGDQIVVSFRGSSNAQDWIDDFDTTLIDYPWVSDGEVHQGFYEAWGDLASEAMSVTTSLMGQHTSSPVLVTGHSLGAALAQIAASNFSRYADENGLSNPVMTYTYGSPRWGNEAVADYYATIIDLNWRMVNLHDAVPTVPKEFEGYHHTWTEVHYTSDKPLTYTVCDGSGEDKSCSYDIPSAEDHLWYFDLYEDCESR